MRKLSALLLALSLVLSVCMMLPACSYAEGAEEPAETPAPSARVNPLDKIDLSAEDKRALFREVRDAFAKELSPDALAGMSVDEERSKENEILGAAAARFGVSVEDATQIYTMASFGYLYDLDPASFSVRHGDLLEAKIVDTSLILKAKIQPSYSNKATIDQNYYNVCDVIRKQGGDAFDEIQYWAVADMADGSEGKVISFTVGSDLISVIAAGPFADNMLGNYLSDLWVLPSLKN